MSETIINLEGINVGGVKLINLCPHDLHIYNTSGELLHTIPKSGIIARIATTQESIGSIGEINVVRTRYGRVEGLANYDCTDETFYLVSTMVAQVVCRKDVLSPDTFNGVVRDEKGQIKGVTQLQSFYPGKLGKL